jgi:hypothetical protein
MNVEFFDPEDVPVPPEEVRFRNISVEVYPDNRRIRLMIEITPFQDPPNLEINAYNGEGQPVASTSIIGAMGPQMALTLHLRGENPPGEYMLEGLLAYEGEEIIDRDQITFLLPERKSKGQGET